jgi:hypothetical protein
MRSADRRLNRRGFEQAFAQRAEPRPAGRAAGGLRWSTSTVQADQRRHGHQAATRRSSRSPGASALLRSYDICARWGGDEFILLIATNAISHSLSSVAEDCRGRLRGEPIRWTGGASEIADDQHRREPPRRRRTELTEARAAPGRCRALRRQAWRAWRRLRHQPIATPLKLPTQQPGKPRFHPLRLADHASGEVELDLHRLRLVGGEIEGLDRALDRDRGGQQRRQVDRCPSRSSPPPSRTPHGSGRSRAGRTPWRRDIHRQGEIAADADLDDDATRPDHVEGAGQRVLVAGSLEHHVEGALLARRIRPSAAPARP